MRPNLKINPELEEAISYFHQAEKYGYSRPEVDDFTEEEIIAEYRKCLAHENIDDLDS